VADLSGKDPEGIGSPHWTISTTGLFGSPA
jgi:hypothetical protein